ncbi:MAG: zinc-ribbon domain-containing protein [Patescibacteria group bacterium]|jgi:uncharacterized membrane protein YvbJ
MFCSHCGKEIIDNSKFCQNCGSKLIKKKNVLGRSLSQEEINDIYHPKPTKSPTIPSKSTTTKPHRINAAIIVIGIFLILMALGSGDEVDPLSLAGSVTLAFVIFGIIVLPAILYRAIITSRDKDKED